MFGQRIAANMTKMKSDVKEKINIKLI